MKYFVFVQLRVPGFHAYADAPDAVEYLRTRHRHLFHVRVEVEVSHGEREIEFHMMLNDLWDSLFPNGLVEFGNNSCENIASTIVSYIESKYGKWRQVTVEVSEDGENGSRVRNF